MDDRELLELAAKAAGVFLTKEQFERECTSPWDAEWEPYYDDESGSMHGWRTWYGRSGERGGWEGFEWNPLDDDGEAIRLAVQLGMNIIVLREGGCIVKIDGVYRAEELGDDPLAATRRAIVCAAAALAKDAEAR